MRRHSTITPKHRRPCAAHILVHPAIQISHSPMHSRDDACMTQAIYKSRSQNPAKPTLCLAP
jgi:hypothetical protein